MTLHRDKKIGNNSYRERKEKKRKERGEGKKLKNKEEKPFSVMRVPLTRCQSGIFELSMTIIRISIELLLLSLNTSIIRVIRITSYHYDLVIV